MSIPTLSRRIAIAPMMAWSDRHCRMFWRQLTRHSLLYTEMVTAQAVLYGGPERFFAHHPEEHPLALQLGGSDPAMLASAAAQGEAWGFDEINLNCGCPSDRVQSGRFGACLMAEPALVGDCVAAMCDAVSVPVTVKHRIGIDDLDSYALLRDFVGTVAERGCRTFIVHARKAWLQGLSPRENREVPPLDYPRVYRLKADFPELEIIINGGIDSLDTCQEHLAHVDGVMLGRAAYQDPYLLAGVDRMFFGATSPAPNRGDVLVGWLPYVEAQLAAGCRLSHLTRHILGLYQHCPGARQFRRHISEHAHRRGAGINVLTDALALVEPAALATV
ncbi:MAG: tRNA dihydrouridine(20/20a) synthase DusA [Spongiibacteraceae bacterium]|nr:tRNA dihydrouridine(20/20a) synthase DusA [Spongiibacteraceae bacterium]